MRITTETNEKDILKAILERNIQEYLDNGEDRKYLDNTLEKNIIFWARALKQYLTSKTMRGDIYWAMYKWKGGDPLTLQEAEDALTNDDAPICEVCGKGLY